MKTLPPFILLALLVTIQSPAGAQQIQITSVPTYGQNGSIAGRVTGVANPQNYVVAPYIQIEGAGWYNKPYNSQPTVAVNPDGTFTANVTTGGVDPLATIYYAALLPAGASPPVGSFDRIPAALNPVAATSYERYPASLTFAGRSWAVKGPYYAGPNGNNFSTGSSDVWVDSAGMHLSIHQHDGKWWATEVILPQHLGYGTYSFTTRYNIDALDRNITFGAFTWDPYGQDSRMPAWPYREIDFEDGRWGNAADPHNTQSLLQPWQANTPNRIAIPSGDVTVTRFFTWQPGGVRFVTLLGDHTPTNYAPADVLQDWTYTENVAANKIVPTPGGEMFHFNMWLNNTTGPANGQPAEALITNFGFLAPAVTRTWSGAGSNSLLATAANWSNGLPAVNDTIVFGTTGLGRPAPDNSGTGALVAVGGIRFDALGYTLTGSSPLTVSGPIHNNTAMATIDAPLLLTVSGVIDGGGPGQLLMINGPIGGAVGLTKTGAGIVILGLNTSYTGDTDVRAGTLIVPGLASSGSTTVSGTLMADYIRQESLTINAGGAVYLSASGGPTSTSVVNFLRIANGSGGFGWGAEGDAIPAGLPSDPGNTAAVPEPTGAALLALAAMALLIRRLSAAVGR